MSRSYKKYPLFRDCLWGRSMKKGKQHFNRKLRRKYKDIDLDIGNGNYYRKINNNYDLYEYKSTYSKQEIIDEWYEDQQEVANGVNSWKAKWLAKYSLEEALVDWYKHYKTK